MQFIVRKRRPPPSVIIVSLIDVLIVVLIFLMVTTTFKQQPSVKLSLPESRQSSPGASEKVNLIVTIQKQGPVFLATQPVTLDKLQEVLKQAVDKNPHTTLSINADTDAPFGTIIKVMDAAKAARIEAVNAFTRNAAAP